MPLGIAGSCAAAETYGSKEWADLDVFAYSDHALVAATQSLLDHGFTMDERFERVWYRWLRYGFKGWHTNSMKLHSPSDVEVNVIHKTIGGSATTSLAQVLESFDFGLLATGYDVESEQRMDMRGYLFPNHDPNGPLPMLPNKRENWVRGYISQYNGLREAARYAKYHGYGYDMSLVKDDLVTGYEAAAHYNSRDGFDEDKKLLAQIYDTLGDKIRADAIDELIESYKTLDFKDPLDLIMDKLE